MADQTGLGTLGVDMTKINPYGSSDAELQTINNALEKNISALQERYAKPNWFKIAAGFAKPQLGGFIASLGSASDAMGENIEKQRESEIPIAQMRSQLALGQSLLSKRKNVSDDIAKWKVEHQGQLPPPAQIAEWAARSPDLPAVQAMAEQQKTAAQQQELQIRRQENALRAAQLERDFGIKIPSGGEIESPTTVTGGPSGNAPTGDSPTSVVGKSSTGARLNPEQQALLSLGIPIISGIRTPEEQAALRDHQDASGKWVTAQGLPVADNSQHTTGNAVDVDSSKLSENQKQILKSLGYTQPLPNDPNHWQKGEGSSDQPKKAPQILGDTNISFNPLSTQSDTARLQGLTKEAVEKVHQQRYSSLESVGNPQNFESSQQAIDSMIKAINSNPQMANKVLNIVTGQGGVAGAIRNVLESGVGVNIQGFLGNVQIPVRPAMIGALSKQENDFYNLLISQSANISKIQQRIEGVNPNGISNAELDVLKSAGVNPKTQGVNTILYNLYYTKLNSQMLHDMYQKANSIYEGRDKDYALNPNSPTKMADIMRSPAMTEIAKSYEQRFKKLNEGFLSKIGGKTQ
jgi:hypothetical protein